MNHSITVATTKITSAEIDKIATAFPADVHISKILASDPVVFTGHKFSCMEIVASNFKCGLAFIDCTFSGNVSFKEIKAGASVSFVNCRFHGDVTMFSTEVTAPISVVRCRIDGHLHLDGSSTPKIDIQSSSAMDFRIVAQEVPSQVQSMSLDNFSVSGAVRIRGITGLAHVNLNNCSASELIFARVHLAAKSSVVIGGCRITEILLDELTLAHSKLGISSTVGKNLYLKRCRFGGSQLVFSEVLVDGLFAIRHCIYSDSSLDIAQVTTTQLELDESLFSFIMSPKKGGITLLPSTLSEVGQVQTLKLLKDKFAREHRYDLEDGTFYLLKNLEYRIRFRSSSWWQKPVMWLVYLVSRYVVGWGVKLRNPLLSVILLIMTCALVYYFSIGFSGDAYMHYLGAKSGGLYGATAFSVLAFFGQHADAEVSGSVPTLIALSQFIVGVVMLTIIAGMLIRKLVR
jgi:hypothetical protein